MTITAFCAEIRPNRPNIPSHVPNQIIVKFNKTTASNIRQQQDYQSQNQLRMSSDLEILKKQYRITAITPLFQIQQNENRQTNFLNDTATPRYPKNNLDRIFLLQLDIEPDKSITQALQAFQNNHNIEYAELNQIISLDKIPNDPCYPLQWPLENLGQIYPAPGDPNYPISGTVDADIDASQAWDIHTGKDDVIVAVVDTGVDYTHRDLQKNIWINQIEANGKEGFDDDLNGYIDDIYGWDFFNNDNNPVDDHGHGTHCAGIISAETDNNYDIAGISWNSRIMPLKFIGSNGSGPVSAAVLAIYYAVENGANIISNSWGSSGYSQTVKETIDYAYSNGVVMIAAAGNNGSNSPHYPAAYDHIMAIAATDANDHNAPFTNYGDWVDLAAPGMHILSLRAANTSLGTIYTDYTTIASGTSMACPHVAGACALLISYNKTLTFDDLYDILIQTADPITPGIVRYDGRLNLYNAMQHAIPERGSIDIKYDYYSCDSVININLSDIHLAQKQTHQVILITDSGDMETVVLNEMSPNWGVFTGSIQTNQNPVIVEDSLLQVDHNQIITAVYEDANDGTGSPNTINDTALIDCLPPIISDIMMDIPGPEPKISFQTDELTSGKLFVGQTCHDQNDFLPHNPILAVNHTLNLKGVQPDTDYYFTIEATDAVGNKTIEDNLNQCYTFTTDGPNDLYVPADYLTIQQAIDYSWDTGSVIVADGTYTGQGNRNIDFKGKAITVRSQSGHQACVIDCDSPILGFNRGFIFQSNEGHDSVLDGFTIKNGQHFIAGALFVQNSSPRIKNCILTNCNSLIFGGALFCTNSNTVLENITFSNNTSFLGGAIVSINSNLTITDSIITDNTAFDGGGISIYSGNIKIENSIIHHNTALIGAGIHTGADTYADIQNCLFTANRATKYFGGGALFLYDDANITNCTIASNIADVNAAGLAIGRGFVRIKNSIFADNNAPNNPQIAVNSTWPLITYSNIQGSWPNRRHFRKNINADPRFVQPGYFDSNGTWHDGDYHLLPDSPCVNTGRFEQKLINDTDLDKFPRVMGNKPDMGAYETPEAQLYIWPSNIRSRSSKPDDMYAYLIIPTGIIDDYHNNHPFKLYVTDPQTHIESHSATHFQHGQNTIYIILFEKSDVLTLLSQTGRYDLFIPIKLTNDQVLYPYSTIKIQ
jgi:subtilisin family serine protease